eukprot:195029_1
MRMPSMTIDKWQYRVTEATKKRTWTIKQTIHVITIRSQSIRTLFTTHYHYCVVCINFELMCVYVIIFFAQECVIQKLHFSKTLCKKSLVFFKSLFRIYVPLPHALLYNADSCTYDKSYSR